MKTGDRIKKRGMGHAGTVEKVSDAGRVRVKWDEGVHPRTRPALCDPRELEEA